MNQRHDEVPPNWDEVPIEEEGKPNGEDEGADGASQSQSKPTIPELLSAACFVEGFTAPCYIIDGILLKSRVYSLTGGTGHGKTAIALSLAVHVALGRQLHGRRVEQGRAVYLAAENPDDVRMRLLLMADRMGLGLGNLPLHFAPGTFRLEDGFAEMKQAVEALGGVDFVVVDTGAAFLLASGAEDENSNLELFNFAVQLRKLTELPGNPTALALMHPIKHASQQAQLLPRGGGAFLNEMDGNLTVFAEGDRTITELGWAGKHRGPSFDPLPFALEAGTAPGLVDASGRSIPSVWATPADQGRVEQAERSKLRDEDKLLVVMQRNPKASLASWADMLGWRFADGNPAKSRVQRALEGLRDLKLVRKDGRIWALTKAGKQQASDLENGHD